MSLSFFVLMTSSVVGGFSTSLLLSVFESWMIAEHNQMVILLSPFFGLVLHDSPRPFFSRRLIFPGSRLPRVRRPSRRKKTKGRGNISPLGPVLSLALPCQFEILSLSLPFHGGGFFSFQWFSSASSLSGANDNTAIDTSIFSNGAFNIDVDLIPGDSNGFFDYDMIIAKPETFFFFCLLTLRTLIPEGWFLLSKLNDSQLSKTSDSKVGIRMA